MGSLNFLTHEAFRVPPPVELTEQGQSVFFEWVQLHCYKVATLSEQNKVTETIKEFLTQKYRF
jgi:hypothetical protein